MWKKAEASTLKVPVQSYIDRKQANGPDYLLSCCYNASEAPLLDLNSLQNSCVNMVSTLHRKCRYLIGLVSGMTMTDRKLT